MTPLRRSRPYWWFQGASVVELLARLTEAGPDARLEVHLAPNQKMTFAVLSPDDVNRLAPIKPPINESHVCPPDCG